MSNETYIGHRYVPQVEGEWSKNKAYEELSIVLHEGSSYTSKQKVPEGVDITNETFWILSGNYNAQIENYRSEVNEVTTQLTQTENRTNGFINIKEFGVVGDGVTDDTLSIQQALDHAFENNLFLEGFYGDFLVSDTITILCNGDLSMMNIHADGTTVSPVVRTGYTVGDKTIANREIHLPAVINNSNGDYTTNWTGTGIGIEIANTLQSTIYQKSVFGFKTGLRLYGYDKGTAYNQINLQSFYACQVPLEIDASLSGWANENLFNNGNLPPRAYAGGSLASDWVGTRGIKITKGNNNVFIKPCFESVYSEYGIEIIHGSHNQFIGARYEGVGAQKVYFNSSSDDSTHSNLFIGGYDINRVQFIYNHQFSSKYNSIISGRGVNRLDNLFLSSDGMSVFNSRSIMDRTIDSMNWKTKVSHEGIFAKADSDTQPAVSITPNGFLNFGDKYIRSYNGFRFSGGNIHSLMDNQDSVGSASHRWSQVYAGTGTINTSDEREKDAIDSIPDSWLDAWGDVEWVRYKFKDSITAKGIDGARYHTGLVAQQVKRAFENRGLDPFETGILCFDEWEADDENNILSGDRYGIRYEEALSLESAYQRRELERIKSKMV